ncbi:peptidyl-prolyl cis-trans isomerase CYP28, chloroplastic isoform X1 [Amborella trichopoda]|uniref:peptidyl-prolyl cis-trans isomerase CYP28, chloroplastic isoform X1 n=1 Tax=Amborella trichopoda TaxID=13333 RepID=UPI0005D459F6|nr:peptidyl-prolyl cis-trans isomerase CYP28, chloroplastic isoform X1 [Amborella trichopoda]|eukprot:XP_011625072.1 peptidyl-prolyl cis-trans isomerase CYP28, chloroplastic isoform X1 [Amborella trichopoda]
MALLSLSSPTTFRARAHLIHRPGPRSTKPRPLRRRDLILLTVTTSALNFSPHFLALASEYLAGNQSEFAGNFHEISGESSEIAGKSLDTTITDRVFMDFSVCPSYFRPERTAEEDLPACSDLELLGRVVLGLYGKHLPRTVANFKAMCNGSAGSSYKGSLVQKVFPGQYLMAGKQGRRDKGEVQVPLGLERNTETVDPRAFLLKHVRPGTLSLCLSENDDEDDVKLDPNYRNVEFLITTGPGPCPNLDNRNIVFGAVLEGLDVVRTLATIPTFKPSERIRQFNDLAEFLGDERAQNARSIWNRPLKTVSISNCGELKVVNPSLSP